MPAGLPTRIRSLFAHRSLSSSLYRLLNQRSNLFRIRTLTLSLEMGSQGPLRRPFCHKCSKPAQICLCNRIKFPPLDNSIRVTILQHSLEKNHPLNSTRVAVLGLKNLAIIPVTDVNFEAQYCIHALEPDGDSGSDGIGANFLENPDYEKKLNFSDAQSVITDELVGHYSENLDSEKSLIFSAACSKIGEDLNGGFANCIVNAKHWNCEENPDSDKSLDFSAAQISRAKYGGLGNQLEKLDLESILSSPTSEVSVLETDSQNGDSSFLDSQNSRQKHEFPSPAKLQSERLDSGQIAEFQAVQEDFVTSTSAKCSFTCSLRHLWIKLERAAKPDISWVLASPVGKAAISNGFVVKKLQRKQLHASNEFEDFEEFDILIPPGSALLFPSEKSVTLEEVDFKVKHLIVLDGTWKKAKRVYHENPWLKLLPHLKLDSRKESLYSEVRHQPKAGCLSTIESIVIALNALGDNMEGLDNLLDVFESMVADQRRCKDEKFMYSS